MTINEALQRIQGKGAGIMNQASVRYAQTLLLPDEEIAAAVVANIATRGERFPGVVVLTDRRAMAVCGLPGIKRSVIFDLEDLEKCEEKPTALNYKATFLAGETAFALTVDPEVGEKFSRCVAVLNGEEDDFDAVGPGTDSRIFNPTLVRSRMRVRRAREKERAQRMAAQEEARAKAEASQKERTENIHLGEEDENTQAVAERLARQLDEAKAKGQVDSTDPQAVAARLAAELAAEEAKQNSSN